MRHKRRAERGRLRFRMAAVGLLCAAAFMVLCCALNGEQTGARPWDSAPNDTPTPVPTSTPGPDIDTGVGESFRLELLSVSAAQSELPLTGALPTVLIYHTHATEAYRQVEGHEYEESGSWRTQDEQNSIIAVGEELRRILLEKYGIIALHDTKNHEPPKLSSAYSRSVKTMEDYREDYPSIQLYIDVHRDAYGTSPSGQEDFVTINGRETARLMFVVGTGEGATGTGFAEMPDFAANYALAKRLTQSLNDIHPDLTRSIRVKTGRYNQHIGRCILVEVGHNANTLEQAKNAMPHLACAIAAAAGISDAPAMLPLAPRQ